IPLGVAQSSAFDGFIRFAGRPASGLVSGYPADWDHPINWNRVLSDAAPWSVQSTQAASAVVLAAIKDKKVANEEIYLRTPRASKRGLVLLSIDRPDELEALPRLGAGPGSFTDVPLEITSPPADPNARIVTVILNKLSLSFDSAGAERDDLDIDLLF